MKKKIVLIWSFIGSIIAVFSWYYLKQDSVICYNTSWSNIENTCGLLIMIFSVFIPIFISCVFIYISKRNIFSTWSVFTFVYLCIYIFILILAPEKCDAYLPICKTTSFLFLMPLYILSSLILIIYKSFKKE